MALKTTTLRPGLLVGLKTSIYGGVRYAVQTIESEHVTEEGAEKASWQTERTVTDPKEYEAATTARSKARQAVARVCSNSSFGLLCPEINEEALEGAIAEAQQIVAEFNATAKYSRITVNVLTGRIAPDDVKAVQAINSEVRDLLETMERGLANLDVKAVRDAASRTIKIGTMLTPATEARVRIAVDAARLAARNIKKAGETAAQEIDKVAIRRITETRLAFLDMDGQGEIQAPTTLAPAIDLAPEGVEVVAAPKTPAVAAMDF